MQILTEANGLSNSPSVRAIIEVLRADGATDTEIIEFPLKVLPPK